MQIIFTSFFGIPSSFPAELFIIFPKCCNNNVQNFYFIYLIVKLFEFLINKINF